MSNSKLYPEYFVLSNCEASAVWSLKRYITPSQDLLKIFDYLYKCCCMTTLSMINKVDFVAHLIDIAHHFLIQPSYTEISIHYF